MIRLNYVDSSIVKKVKKLAGQREGTRASIHCQQEQESFLMEKFNSNRSFSLRKQINKHVVYVLKSII